MHVSFGVGSRHPKENLYTAIVEPYGSPLVVPSVLLVLVPPSNGSGAPPPTPPKSRVWYYHKLRVSCYGALRVSWDYDTIVTILE